ncbi:hypothetical protein ACFE04_003240 [Oxalis oulophora]
METISCKKLQPAMRFMWPKFLFVDFDIRLTLGPSHSHDDVVFFFVKGSTKAGRKVKVHAPLLANIDGHNSPSMIFLHQSYTLPSMPDVKVEEEELQAKKAELRRKEHMIDSSVSSEIIMLLVSSIIFVLTATAVFASEMVKNHLYRAAFLVVMIYLYETGSKAGISDS